MAFAWIQHKPQWQIGLAHFDVAIKLVTLAWRNARVIRSVHDQQRRFSFLDMIDWRDFEHALPILPWPFQAVHIEHFLRNIGRAKFADLVGNANKHDARCKFLAERG